MTQLRELTKEEWLKLLLRTCDDAKRALVTLGMYSQASEVSDLEKRIREYLGLVYTEELIKNLNRQQ